MKRSGYFEEYIPTNGIETYLLHYPEETGKPVLLYVHGGPGESAVPFMRFFKRSFGPVCSLVTYDQRGTGRTFSRNPNSKPDMELLLEDLRAVVEHVKLRYGVSKIALIGQSWGSGLGSVYALRHPEDLLCFIGVGQLIDGHENERTGYEALRERILVSKNADDLAALDAVGAYPFGESDPFTFEKLMRVRKLQRKYGLAVKIGSRFYRAILSSPNVRLSDLSILKKTFSFNREMIEWVITEFSLYAYTPKYAVPIYYLLGDRDGQTPFSISSAYFQTIDAPAKRLYVIHGAGHFPQLDNLPDFVRALTDVLKDPSHFGLSAAETNRV